METAMLKLVDIKKDYRVADTTVHALKGVSLAFRKNEFVSILGHSGCGKTTMLNIIGGLDHYSAGDLIIRGTSTKNFGDKDWDAYRNHSIGFVFQSYNLIPHQTVLGNVELALTLSGVSAAERRERAKQALIRVGLGDHISQRPNQLSGGQMQRVAIARALVNDPEILLADEPTGALDSDTSVQIMELIKEIAGERLVIMVTHNPELAERYSTRIVRLTDGVVVDDSNPFTEEGDQSSAPQAESAASDSAPKRKKKTSMSFLTAFGLSGRNLLTKKGRTLITSIAGSIGIIGVCLVLALSSGFGGYITRTEEDMLSAYPVEITETAMDYTTIMENMMNGMTPPQLDRLDDKVYVNSFLTKLSEGMSVQNNITQEYLDYVGRIDPQTYGAIQYGYGMSLSENLYTEVSVDPTVAGFTQEVMNGPYFDMKIKDGKAHWSIEAIFNYYNMLLNSDAAAEYASLSGLLSTLTSTFGKMPGTEDLQSDTYADYVLSQYDIVDEGGRMPGAENEIVLVIDSKNEVNDLILAQLGFLSQEQFLGLFGEDGVKAEDISISFEQIKQKKFTFYYNDVIYTENTPNALNPFAFRYNYSRNDLTASEQEGIELKIVGILKPKKDMNYGCLSLGLNCTEALVNKLRADSLQSKLIQWMNAEGKGFTPGESGTEYNVPCKMNYFTVQSPADKYESQVEWKSAIRAYGGGARANSIRIYAKDFETKNQILDYLDAWNRSQELFGDNGNVIHYTDRVGLMMSIVQTILDAITYVLVAFTGISLVVSSVMIGVITYVSVVERTKEIGVLRSIGARKRDIKSVFNAETFIIGLIAGLIGVFVSYLLCLIVNLILTPLTGISGLASLPVHQAAIMVLVSVVLTLVSGLIPASAAAKKDPVIALRTE